MMAAKTSSYIDDLDVIRELFPTAKYVHLVRDGRDVALSLSKIYFGPKSTFTAAMRWRDTVQKGDRFAASLPPGQVLNLRYEDMLTDPLPFFSGLAEFLEVDDVHKQLPSGALEMLKLSNFGKWKDEWSKNEVASFEQFAGTELRRHGYDTMTDRESIEGTAWQSLVWGTHDEILKWRFPKYWADNAYKAKLVARSFYHLLA